MKNLLQATVFNENKNYQIRYEAQKHWISYVLPVIMIVIGSIGIIPVFFGMGSVRIIGVILLFFLIKGCIKLVKKMNTRIFVTKDHLTISHNFLGKTITDISLKKLEGILLSQNFLGKLLNYGTLTVTTGDVSQQYIVKNPMELREKVIINT